ncbi:MAG: hypothetical protein U1E73_06860 [Planctomycetota bacterium]
MIVALLVLSSLAPAPLAQGVRGSQGVRDDQGVREGAVGEVRTRANAAWAGVEVVLVSRPIPEDDGLGSEDRVVATTDDRGRFRAPVLAGRPYTVWAWGAATATGCAATAVAERVFAQEPVLLREARTIAPRTLVLDHAERWRGHDGYRVRIVQRTGNRMVEWRDVVDGRVALPPLVADARVGLFVRRGEFTVPLLAVDVSSNGADDVHVEVPEATRVTCELILPNDPKARAGARVCSQQDHVLYPVGITDEHGKLGLDLPAGPRSRRGLLVFAEGQMAGVFGASKAATDTLTCTTSPGRTVHVRVLGDGGRPIVGLAASCSGMAHNRPTVSSMQSTSLQRSFTTDGDGRLCIDGIGYAAPALHFALDAAALHSLPEPWRHGMAPVVVAPLAGATGDGSAEAPFVVDLLHMSPVRLQFTGPAGTPLSGVDVALCTLQPYVWGPWGMDTASNGMAADARGRLCVLVPAGIHLGLRAVSGMSVLIRAMETSPPCAIAPPAELTMEMPPPTGIRGRLLLPSGGPAAGRMLSASFATDNTPAEWT